MGGIELSLKNMRCVLGKFDIPIIQQQPPFEVDLLDTNLLLFGASMSGKSTFLRTLINILHKQFNETQEQIFLLDFGETLSDLEAMPLVAACFDNSNEEYVKRVFKIMDVVLKENIKVLNGKNYRDCDRQPIHTTLIIDNVNAFLDEPRYANYGEKLAKLCRDGLSRGITVVMTASETKGMTPYLNTFKQKIAFEMPPDKYMEIFNSKVGAISNYPGHGFANVTVKPKNVTGTFRMNLPYEVQCTAPYIGPEIRAEHPNDPSNTREEYARKLRDKFGYTADGYQRTVKKYRTFPKELTKADYFELLTADGAAVVDKNLIPVGLDYVDFRPVGIDLKNNHVIAIYGKKEFGKTNLLNLILSRFAEDHPKARFVLFDDGRKQLSPDYLKLPKSADVICFQKFDEVPLPPLSAPGNAQDGFVKKLPPPSGQGHTQGSVTKKLSPLQQFYLYLNENYISMEKRALAGIFDMKPEMGAQISRIPGCKGEENPFTVFVIQSKLIYLNAAENRYFINSVLPQLAAVAEEQGYVFIFSDVQKINDGEENQFFNNAVSVAFLLDNIAEFAAERGQKTIFGNMDVKMLKEDYARCEKGDGYFYDVEADNLQKLKFMKFE